MNMADPEQHEMPFQARRIKNPKLRRGIFLLPAAFTSANLLCGYYAIVASLLGTPDDFNRAAKAIGLAILFDSVDGRVARMTGTNTEFGVQFDSLADVVSFGVAPAILAYASRTALQIPCSSQSFVPLARPPSQTISQVQSPSPRG